MPKLIQITKDKTEQSKPQKDFNKLVAKTEKLEKEVLKFREGLVMLQQQIQTVFVPKRDEYYKHNVALLQVYDRAHDSTFFTRTEKKKLVSLIKKDIYELLESGNFDEVLIPMFDKYHEHTYQEEQEYLDSLSKDYMKDFFSMAGIDLDEDADLGNPEKLAEKIAQKMALESEEFEAEKQQKEEKKAKRPKTKTQEKQEIEARSITKSVRSIYMDLVKAFHPDREPDAQERERKTQIMQRVTEAYESNNLLGLLRLQLEFERIDQTHIENLAEDQLKNYNKLLKDQIKDLEGELDFLRMQACSISQYPFYMVKSIDKVFSLLNDDIEETIELANAYRLSKESLKNNLAMKDFLKGYKIPR